MTPPDDSLTDPDWSDPDWSAPEERATPRWARRDRPTPVEPERGRTAALVAAASVAVVVAVVAAVVSVPAATPAAPPTDAAVVAPVGAYSSSAFCPAGTGTAATTTIYLTNSTRRAVTGAMTAVGTPVSGGTVPATHQPVRVPPLGTLAVDPVAGLPAGSTAASFTFAGGGVVVTQAVSGPGGWSTAPCPSQISSQWGFAGGSTAAGNSLTLSLFDPAAVEAVVNVSFITEAGVITPQQYQGLVVPPGQLVDENVGDFVQGRNTIATLVDAQAGGVVASEFQQWSGASTGVSLRAGSPSPSTTWRFAQTTALPQSTVDITLANPGQTAATATISLGLSSGSVVPHRLVVAPSSVAVFSASGTAGLPEQVPYALTITSSAPIVAGRSVEAPSRLGPAGVGFVVRHGHGGHALAGARPRHPERARNGRRRRRQPGGGQSGTVAGPGRGGHPRWEPSGGRVHRGPRPVECPRFPAGRGSAGSHRVGLGARQRRGGQRAVRRPRRGVLDRLPPGRLGPVRAAY